MIILPEHALKSQNLASYTKLKTYNDKKIYRKDINIITLESHPHIKYYIQLENLHKRVYSYEPRRNVVRLLFQIDKTNPKKKTKRKKGKSVKIIFALIKRHSYRKQEPHLLRIRWRCASKTHNSNSLRISGGERKETGDNRRGPPGSREKANPSLEPISLKALRLGQLGEFSRQFSRKSRDWRNVGMKTRDDIDRIARTIDRRLFAGAGPGGTVKGGEGCIPMGSIAVCTSYARYVEGVRDRLMWPRHRSNKAWHNGRTPGTLDGWIAGVVMFRGGRLGARRHRRKGAWLRWIYYPPLAAITNEIQCAITYVRRDVHAKVLSVSRLYSNVTSRRRRAPPSLIWFLFFLGRIRRTCCHCVFGNSEIVKHGITNFLNRA